MGVLMAGLQDRFNCQSVGVDPNPEYRKWSIERFHEAQTLADEKKIDLVVDIPAVYEKIGDMKSEKKFDTITISHTLEHMVDPVGTMRNLRENYHNNGGLLMVETPNIFGTVGRASPLMFPHIFAFSSFTLADTITRAGYSMLDIEVIGTGPPFYSGPFFIVALAVNGTATYNKTYVLERMRLQKKDQDRILAAAGRAQAGPSVG
jgi:SAM-dependent methyltransferase